MNSSIILIKLCRICGDQASGFNYSGLCCESCKLFFIRNAPNLNKLKCLKNEECNIDILTLKSCPKCRLQKCFLNGMELTTSGKQEHSSRIMKNYLNIRNVLQSIDQYQECSSYENPLNHILAPCLHINTRKKKYATDLIVLERQIIANIQNIQNDAFVDETNLRIIGSLDRLVDTYNQSGLYIRRVIKFCKNIPEFKLLDKADQLTILKPFYFEILVCRFVFMWDKVKHGYPIMENESGSQALFVNIDILNQLQNKELAQKSIAFRRELYLEFENDFTIRDLMIAVMLFKPRENVSKLEFVNYQHSLYCRLLKRYLEHKYKNIVQAERKYLSLIKLSNYFYAQQMDSRTVLQTEMDLGQLSQIIVEAFNFDV